MSYTISSSFTYAPDVVDFDAMNITETFPEASSFSFELSNSYNQSYSDSISGIPLAQQALWDDGQLSMHHTINSSRVFGHSSAMSSLNNSANNSMISSQPPSRHHLVPPPQYGHHRSLAQHQSSPLKGEYPYSDNENGSEDNTGHQFDEYEESSLQNSWVDDTRDQNGIMLLNDKEHQDEQHLLFLQDIASANLSRGDSISLFANLADESDLSCDLFKEELDANDTRDHSRLQIEQFPGSSDNPPLQITTSGDFNNNGRAIENEIFDKEFMASLKTPLVQNPPPPLPSASSKNILDGLHTVGTPKLTDEDVRQQMNVNPEAKRGNEAYQNALKSFYDSLKVADPIKTPHKFAPQPLPILWNEPKIRQKGLPTFNLADYRDQAKAVLATKGVPSFVNGISSLNMRDSYSSSPTTTHSIPDSSQSSPLSSAGASPPSDANPKMSHSLKTPTIGTYNNFEEQQKQTLSPNSVRSKRQPSISNPHLAFDPTIPPSERAEESKSLKGTLERRPMLQQPVRSKAQQSDPEDNDLGTIRRSIPQSTGVERTESTNESPGIGMSGLRGPIVRKRRSLHQDMFTQEQREDVEVNVGHQEYHENQNDMEDEQRQSNEAGRRGSSILPESLTTVNNHALRQDIANQERARRLSDESTAASKIPGTLSLGRATGTRYGRSDSNSSGSMAQPSPTTPTAANPHGTMGLRTPKQNIQRPSLSGLSGMYTKQQFPDEVESLSAQVQDLGLSKLPSPAFRRSGSQGLDYQKSPRLPLPADSNDDFYFAEQNKNDAPEWQEDEVQEYRYQPANQQLKPRELPPPLTRRPSSERELQTLQRLRNQQATRDEGYGRGYGNGYIDDQEFIDEIQGGHGRQIGGIHQRNASLSPTRDYFSSTTKSGPGFMRNSPPVLTQTRNTEHYRRPSKDGHSLLPAPRISPPLNPVSSIRPAPANMMNGIGNGGIARRSASDGRGNVVSSLPSRRLSNAANVGSSGYGSALPTGSYSTSNLGGMPTSMHTRSGSTGSSSGSSQRSGLYGSSIGASGLTGSVGRMSNIPDLNDLPSLAPRRSISSLVQPSTVTTRRTSGGYGASSGFTSTGGYGANPGLTTTGGYGSNSGLASSGARMSNFGGPAPASPSSPEFARVYVPRQNTSNNGYSGVNNYSNNIRSQNMNDHEMYSYKSDIPARQPSLGSAGSMNNLGHRSSIGTLRNGG
ncbi:hypothetical protein BGZ76_009633, partial [Entomortierella beljakovae]